MSTKIDPFKLNFQLYLLMYLIVFLKLSSELFNYKYDTVSCLKTSL